MLQNFYFCFAPDYIPEKELLLIPLRHSLFSATSDSVRQM